jgi:signal transduction histidine kinase
MCGLIVAFSSHASFAQSIDKAHKLSDPIAYCLSTLAQCTPDKQKAFKGKVPGDLRAVNGGTQDPVTLVYKLPERASNLDYAVLVAPYYTNYCIQFDVVAPRVCTERELTSITLPTDAKQLLSQAVQLPNEQIFPPNVIWGTTKALQMQSTSERDTIKLFTGWFAFICLAALFQLITRRNQQLSITLALLMMAIISRINSTTSFGFSGIVFINPDINRIVDYVTVSIITAFIVHYYAQLVDGYILRTRLIFYTLCSLSAAFILFAKQPAHIMLSLQIAQAVAMIGIVVGMMSVVKAMRTLDRKQGFTLLLGISAIIFGSMIDLYYVLQGMPLIGGTGFAPYGLAIEALCQYILIALRNDSAHQEARKLQQRLLESVRAESAAQTQALQAQALASQAQNEAKLAKAEQDAQQAQHAALALQTEMARKEAEHAQNQLQQADKMASLGQLVASVTHEINTPIGAISSSGQSMTEALNDVAQQLPPLLQQLDAASSQLMVELLQRTQHPKPPLSSREERLLVKQVTEQLEPFNIGQSRQWASMLVNLNIHTKISRYLPLLQHPHSDTIFEAIRNFASAQGNARNVNVAVERVAKIVKALKSFSHFNIGTEKIDATLVEGMETVLTIYQGQTKVGVEVVRNYEDIPLLNCFPDELNQVWTNLIHNALQAMNHEGTLTIGIREENGHAVVSVGDSGCGIPEEIRGKIFDVFFTTKPAGVGSGLGLDIVKKIIDKHHGRIELQSEVGVGTTFTVMLPYHYVEPQESLQE